jgi:hypothetical protein
VYLYIDSSNLEEWESARDGDLVAFETEIDSSDANPFLEAAIERSEIDGELHVTIVTSDSRLLQIVDYGPADRTTPLPRPEPNDESCDPLTRMGDYKTCWDGTQTGWKLHPHPVKLVKIMVEFDVIGPTDDQIEFIRSISYAFTTLSNEAIREIIGDGRQYTTTAREYSNDDLDRIVEEIERLGLGGEGYVDDSWSRLVPVSPEGEELEIDSNELRRHIVQRMLDAGVPIEGGKKPVEWWFMDDYVRLK